MPKDNFQKQTKSAVSFGEYFGKPPKEQEPIDRDDSSPYLLPKDTVRVLKQSNYSIENTYLWYHRLRDYNFSKNEFFKFKGTDKISCLKGNRNPFDFKKFNERQKENAEIIFGKENVFSITLTTSWKLAIGLGDHSVLETSITLHPIYGFPYIPGSAIKGAVRSYIIEEFFECEEETAFKDQGFCKLFGSPKESDFGEFKGILTFMDTYPTHSPHLSLDIMNPHFGEYYQDTSNQKPPGDYYNPVPVIFPVVENTTFQFVVGVDKKYAGVLEKGKFGEKTPFQFIEDFLVRTLREKGIGAKTSAGYGRMDNRNLFYLINSSEKSKEFYEGIMQKVFSAEGIAKYNPKHPINFALFIQPLDEGNSKEFLRKIEDTKKQNIPYRILISADEDNTEISARYVNMTKINSVKTFIMQNLRGTQNVYEYKNEKEIMEITGEFLKQKTGNEILKLKALTLKNIGVFLDTSINFQTGFNVFVGINGTGKSTILRSILLALIGNDSLNENKNYIERLVQIRNKTFVENASIELEFLIDDISYTNKISFDFPKDQADLKISYKTNPMLFQSKDFYKFLCIGFSQLRSGNISEDNSKVIKFPEEPSIWDIESLLYNRQDKKADQFVRWLRNLQTQSYKNKEGINVLIELAFSIMSEIMETKIEFESLEKNDQVWIKTPNSFEGGIEIRLASTGEQELMTWIGYIILRLSEVFGENKNCIKGHAIVLIDEIDASLHPKWQRNLIPVLQKYFPNVQFIVSTHSPYLVSATPPNSLKVIKREEGVVKVIEDYPYYYGNEITKILLSGIMMDEESQSLREPSTQVKIDKLIQMIREDLYDTEEFLSLQKELKSYLPSGDRDLMLSDMEIIRKKTERKKKDA